MADISGWPPERLRALDEAVARALGHTVAYNMPDGPNGPRYPRIYVAGDMDPLPAYSAGCRDTFELMGTFRDVKWELTQDRLGRFLFSWVVGDEWGAPIVAPSMEVAICLAYLEAKGVPFCG